MRADGLEVVRYIVNGLFATALHYAVLSSLLGAAAWTSAGLANLCAAVVGISASFLGSRYFVFRPVRGVLTEQIMRFGALYGLIALLHGVVLLLWSDWLGQDFRIGFLLATGMQVSLSYLGNKWLVFR